VNLSNELISQFVKATKDDKKTSTETTVNGTTVEYGGKIYVKLDGSDLLTPIRTTTDVKPDERVTVLIKDHTATVTGNMSSPAARTDDVKDVANQISEFEIIVSHKVTAEELETTNATIQNLRAKLANVDELHAVFVDIESLEAKLADVEYLNATDIKAINANIEKIQAHFGTFTDLSTEELEALNADIEILKGYTADFTYLSTDTLEAIKADIKELDAKKLSAEQADVRYANIDFANINEAAVKKLFTESGIIKDLVVSGGHITGELVGVTIKGDLIEAGTLKADKLVVKGSDGIYYKLNIEAGAVESAEVTKEELQNGLHGTAIIAKTITAEKIAVDDLVAFGATIGGFNITANAIYSGVKSSATNTTRGVYLDNDGQVAFGDSSNFLRYYKDADGKYHLELSASSIVFSASGESVEDAITETNSRIDGIRVGARNLIRKSTDLIFDRYYFVDQNAFVLGVSKLGLSPIAGEPEPDETEEIETASIEPVAAETINVEPETSSANSSEQYSHQGFKDGMTLHDYHLISMENAIIAALGGVPVSRITTISLMATGWTGSGTIYSQAVEMSNITANSKVDLLPSPEQLNELLLAEISLTAANSDGAITVFAIGSAPTMDLDLQAMITEVVVPEVNV
jgi:hypothetical protein